jgi:hypothetical protein
MAFDSEVEQVYYKSLLVWHGRLWFAHGWCKVGRFLTRISRRRELCECFTVYSRDSPIGVLRVKVAPYNQNYVNGLCFSRNDLLPSPSAPKALFAMSFESPSDPL